MHNLFHQAIEEAHSNFRWSLTEEGRRGWPEMEALIIRSWADSVLSMRWIELVLISARYFMYESVLAPFSFFGRANDHPIYTLLNIGALIYVATQVLQYPIGIPVLGALFLSLEFFVAPGCQRPNTLMFTNILTAGRHMREFAEDLKKYPVTHPHMSDVEFGGFLPKITICAGKEMKQVHDGLLKLYWSRQHMVNPDVSVQIQRALERLALANDQRYRRIAIEIDRNTGSLDREPNHAGERWLSDELLPKLRTLQDAPA